ncbi:hypothetical protein BJ165DRAFT_1382128 [Panaeolus papilionaceus]|nr:hypothetical protein BJ165DRAFT_1382128 [Panaeolus papilionaceus]
MQHLPERLLVVKCTFDKWTKRITFSSARNCSYDLLRSKVEQGFSLYATSFAITYKDDDGVITDISSDDDLSEAVQYFLTGVDDTMSILSSRSFGGRKITLRVNITVDYDGPPLSDTSSLASLEEFKSRNGSQHSFSFGSPSVGDFDDDSRTVSSESKDRTTPSESSGKGISSSSTPIAKQRSIISLSDKSGSLGYSRNGDTTGYQYQRGDSVSDNGPTATGSRFPEYESGPFEQLKHAEEQDDTSSRGSNYMASQTRGAAWLRDQKERARLGVLPDTSESDGMSISQDSLEDPFEGDLSLQMDQRGKYYYNYTSGSSVTREDDVINGIPSAPLSSRNSFQGPRPTSMQLKWLKSQRVDPDQEDSRRSYVRSSASIQEEDPQPFETLDKDLLLFLPVTAPPQELLTDCSNCGVLLEALRYVCSTCGEKAPKGLPDKGKEKDSSPAFTYPPGPHHLFSSPNSSSSETYIGGSESAARRHKPLPSIPSPLSSPLSSFHSFVNRSKPPSSVSNTSSQSTGSGYELCPNCLETVGIHHAIEAGLAAPGSSSLNGFSGAPEDPQSASQWRRAAPKKGQIRHAYQEKMWGHGGWEDKDRLTENVAEHEEAQVSQCSTCSAVTLHKRYKCASCEKMHLCRACYSQVHELHPSHAFIVVPDKPLEVISNVEDIQGHPNEEHSLKHQGVTCAHCLLDIVGARFHCAICDTVDICSNCESAGLPGNLDSDDGGHNSSHILIKIPYPLETTELQNASRRALHLWTGRDAASVGFTFPKTKANSEISSYAQTLIGSSVRSHNRTNEDHHIFCNGCQQSITGIRYQCAHCLSNQSTPGYNLCSSCEVRSYRIHDPFHIFFKVPRPVDRPIESHFPLLPPLYKVPVGPLAGAPVSNDPKGYLRHLIHSSAVCDRCMTCIQGEWFRCCYCARDLCEDCQEVDTHNDKHIFLVFKSSTNQCSCRNFANLESPIPVIPYPIYR